MKMLFFSKEYINDIYFTVGKQDAEGTVTTQVQRGKGT
jgi:hypothetical protein